MKLNSKPYNKKILNYKAEYSKAFKEDHHNKDNKINSKENNDINNNTQSDKEDLISTELFFDEIKLKVDYDKIENELNKLRNNNYNEKDIKVNKNESEISAHSNLKLDGDLFYYSDEEDDKKINNSLLNKNKEEKKEILNGNNILEINIKNIKDIMNDKNDKNFKNREDIKVNTLDNNNKYKDLSIISIEKLEYGIDKNGNPVSIPEFNIEKANKKAEFNNKIIAYIIPSDEKDENYLIDLKGNKISRKKNGDFYYIYENKKIIIKNFDVQNPKLRIYGTRLRYSSLCTELDNKINTLTQNKNLENNDDYINTLEKNKKSALKDKFHYIKNTKNILYQRKNMKTYKANNSINKSHKILFTKNKSSKDIGKETKLLLNKIKNDNILINKFDKVKNNLSLKNIYLNNIKYGNNKVFDNNIMNKENNEDNLSLKNLLINKLKINLGKNNQTYNPLLNGNSRYSISNPDTINCYQYDYPLLSDSSTNISKKSFSCFENNINKNKNNHNPLLDKFKNSRLNFKTSFDEIDSNKKKIKNNIKNTLQKLLNKNKTLNKNYNHSENNISLKLYKSFNNSINEFYNTNYNESKKDKNDKAQNSNKKKIKKIQLDKRYKISISPNKSFKYCVLSKQANDMIKDYANQSLTKRNDEYIKKMNIDEYMKKKEKKSQQSIHQNKITKLKNSLNSNSSKHKIKINNKMKNSNKKEKLIDKNRNKNSKNKNKSKDNSILKKFLERKQNIIKNKIDKGNRCKIVPIQNNLNINIYGNDPKYCYNTNLLKKINKSFQEKIFMN